VKTRHRPYPPGALHQREHRFQVEGVRGTRESGTILHFEPRLLSWVQCVPDRLREFFSRPPRAVRQRLPWSELGRVQPCGPEPVGGYWATTPRACTRRATSRSTCARWDSTRPPASRKLASGVLNFQAGTRETRSGCEMARSPTGDTPYKTTRQTPYADCYRRTIPKPCVGGSTSVGRNLLSGKNSLSNTSALRCGSCCLPASASASTRITTLDYIDPLPPTTTQGNSGIDDLYNEIIIYAAHWASLSKGRVSIAMLSRTMTDRITRSEIPLVALVG
jgi:hypothetical protein